MAVTAPAIASAFKAGRRNCETSPYYTGQNVPRSSIKQKTHGAGILWISQHQE